MAVEVMMQIVRISDTNKMRKHGITVIQAQIWMPIMMELHANISPDVNFIALNVCAAFSFWPLWLTDHSSRPAFGERLTFGLSRTIKPTRRCYKIYNDHMLHGFVLTQIAEHE